MFCLKTGLILQILLIGGMFCRLAQAVCANPAIYFVAKGTCASVGYSKLLIDPFERSWLYLRGYGYKYHIERPSVTSWPTTKDASKVTSQTRTTFSMVLTPKTTSTGPLTVICSSITNVRCATDIEPVCGSDERTYINYCEFHKEVCQHHDLKVKHIGFC